MTPAVVRDIYEADLPLTGDAVRAVARAEDILVASGFQVNVSGDALDAAPARTRSSRQSRFVGATRVELAAREGRLHMRAELGGVTRMRRFGVAFLPALCLGLTLPFVALFRRPELLVLPLVLLAPWLVIAPRITRGVEASTRASLEQLLATAARAPR
ncbi:MAG: hypothetical protein Q8P18_10980 [Pseudomonadota bacterium]|nr:hypothetical protein [Pseudomonadota bacterium]